MKRLAVVSLTVLALVGLSCSRAKSSGAGPAPVAAAVHQESGLVGTGSATAPVARRLPAGPGVPALVALSRQARARAQTIAADAELHQIDINLANQEHIFRFTDTAATQEIDITMPNPTVPPDQWRVVGGYRSQLTGPVRLPALDVQSLRIGPQAAAQALLAFAPNSRVRILTPWRRPPGTGLVWYVSGDVPGGPIRVIISNDTGATKQDGPAGIPIPRPATATPVG